MNGAREVSTNAIDWNSTKRRIAELGRAIDSMGRFSVEQAKKIMDERAAALAKAAVAKDRSEDSISVVEFLLSRETYAIETRYVHEIVRFTQFTPLPGTPEFVVGAANHHGGVMAVFDLRRLLGVRIMPASDLARVVVCGEWRREFGILADNVTRVTTISTAMFPRESARSVEGRSPLIRAVAKDATILLDGGALIRDPRLFVGADRTDTNATPAKE